MSLVVFVREAEDMHVAGLVVARMLERAAESGPLDLPGHIAVEAGMMAATIVPRGNEVEVVRGLVPPLAATIRAPLRTLLDVCGGGSLFYAVVRGHFRMRGSVRALRALRALLAAEGRGS